MTWWVYIVQCKDQTLYTGVTTDLERRLQEHNGKGPTSIRGAKYTRVRRPVRLVFEEPCENRSKACKREAAIKKLTRLNKLSLISNNITINTNLI
ncbi:MAG: putative endonuclease [Bermanella sp.]|jgi:putative endonuclease